MAVKVAKARIEAHALLHRHSASPSHVGADPAAIPGFGFRLADDSVFSCSCPDQGSSALDIGPFTCYRIDCRADNTAIGTIGFHGPPDARQQVTIGYGLVPHSWGNGYATEAVHALIEYCRAHPDVRSIAADTDHDNVASQRVLAKSGFRLVRRDRDLIYYELELGK
jgi:GNAT superfamily N-acetyltransferase